MFSYYGETFDLFYYNNKYFVGAGLSNLMSIFYGSGPYIFRPKMKTIQSMWAKMAEKVLI